MRFPPAASQRKRWTVILTVVVVSAVLLAVWVSVRSLWGRATLRYELTPTAVEIVYGPQRVVLPRRDITSVRLISSLTGARRYVGTAMPGLYEGRWFFNETGPLRLYSTSRDSIVLIETRDGRWGISPADPEGFIAAYQANRAGDYPPVESDSTWALLVLGVIVVVTAAAAGAVIYPLWLIAGRMEYELGDRALVIHGSLSPIVLPYSRITEVRIDNPSGSPLKLVGAAFPGLWWGSFLWKGAGGRINLCATRLRPLVIVSVGRQTYGLSPQDPPRFVEELLRRKGNDAAGPAKT